MFLLKHKYRQHKEIQNLLNTKSH